MLNTRPQAAHLARHWTERVMRCFRCSRLMLFIAAAWPTAGAAQSGWFRQYPPTYRAVASPTLQVAVVVGDQGIIETTHDDGNTWSEAGITNNALRAVSFADANKWHRRRRLWRRPAQHRRRPHLDLLQRRHAPDAVGVCLIDANTAIAAGDLGTILLSTDGGATWTPQESGTTNSLLAVTFRDRDTGTVVGDGGTILRTTNGGATWTPQASGTGLSLFAVSFANTNGGTAVGELGTILHTTNGGTTWLPQISKETVGLSGVSFTDANNGIVVGAGGTILLTTDGGLAARKRFFPSLVSALQIFPNYLFAVRRGAEIAQGMTIGRDRGMTPFALLSGLRFGSGSGDTSPRLAIAGARTTSCT